MSQAFINLPLPALLENLSSSEPVPGGGSASAIAGAVAAALATMVANLTAGKKGYEEAHEEAVAIAPHTAALQGRLLEAAAKDAQAFDAVMAAMALPKATEDEKAARKTAMQHGFKAATRAPLDTAIACVEAGRIALRLLAIGNKNTASDAGVGVLLAVAGTEGALFNVAINLGAIQDADFVAGARGEALALASQAAALREGLTAQLHGAGLDLGQP